MLTILALAALAAPTTSTHYVLADVINVRDAPKSGSKILQRLRINTPVKQVGRKGEWVELETPTGVRGFTKPSLLRAQPLSIEEAIGLATESKSIAWAERAVAIDPSSEQAAKTLLELAEATKSRAGAARAKALLGEKRRGHLAMCVPNPGGHPRSSRSRIVAIGAVASNGKVEAIEVGTPKSPSALVNDLVVAPWFEVTTTATRVLTGTPFANARVVYAWNEPNEGDLEPPEMGEDSEVLVLGPCAQEGTLYATQPIESIPSPSTAADEAMKEKNLDSRIKVEQFRWFHFGDGSQKFSVVQSSNIPGEDGGSPSTKVTVCPRGAVDEATQCLAVDVYGAGC